MRHAIETASNWHEWLTRGKNCGESASLTMEKLIIQNFCGLHEAEFDLAPINIFIGPQATGKSVAAKVVYYFREAIATLPSFVRAQTEWKTVCVKIGERLSNYFGAPETTEPPFLLRYEIEGHWLSVTCPKGSPSPQFEADRFFSDGYQKLLSATKTPKLAGDAAQDTVQVDALQIIKDKFAAIFVSQLGGPAAYDQMFVPAARAALALMPTQILGQIAGRQDFDVWILKFAELLAATRSTLKIFGFYRGQKATDPHGAQFLEKLILEYREDIKQILRAEVDYDGETERLMLQDGRTISLLRASSGQQESLPLLSVIGRFTMLQHPIGRSVFIEEPEAHLWPGAQRKVVRLLAQMYNRRSGQIQLLLTTHSPYVLSSFNNLLEAGRKHSEIKRDIEHAQTGKRKLQLLRKTLQSIVPASLALAPGSVAAWQFSEGHVKPLIESEFGILGADLLDKVSDEIDTEWNDLQEISL